jgi:hypothetical protein
VASHRTAASISPTPAGFHSPAGFHFRSVSVCAAVLLTRSEAKEVLGHLGHDGALVRLLDVDVLDVEQTRDAQALGHAEGQLEVGLGVVLVERVVIDEMRLVLVDERAEGHAVLPVGREIRDRRGVHVTVARSLLSAPEEQSLLARSVLVADSLRSDSKKSEK